MRLLITGSKGQLGSEIKKISSGFPDHLFFFASKEDLDISDAENLNNFLEAKKIDVVINCAAYTAVDKAENESPQAEKINNTAVKNLAEVSKEKAISLIHISTDYVFNGRNYQPYPVENPSDPINVYGKTKLAGENAMRESSPDNSMIIRTSWVYSSFGNNFVKTMLRLGKEKAELNVISDQVGVPTYARDLADFILNYAVKSKHKGVKTYHFTNEGVSSWYDFAKEIIDLSEVDCKINPIPTSAYSTLAKRPSYSLLDKTSLKKDFGVEIPYWKESLKQCIDLLK